MPEPTAGQTYLNVLKKGLMDKYRMLQNFPGSAFRNFVQMPIESLVDVGKMAISSPTTLPHIAAGFTPPGQIADLIALGLNKPQYTSGAYPFLAEALKNLVDQKVKFYSNDENIIQDPAQVVSDALQLTLPFTKSVAGSSAFKNRVLRNVGKSAKEQVTSPYFPDAGSPGMYESLEGAFKRRIPLTALQTSEPKIGGIWSSIGALKASLLDKLLPQKLNAQLQMFDKWGNEFLEGPLDINTGMRSGELAQQLGKTGQGLYKDAKSIIKATRENLFTRANQYKEKAFVFREKDYEDAVEIFKKSEAKNKVAPDINKYITMKEVEGPIQLNETTNVVNSNLDAMDAIKESVIGANPQLFAKYKDLIPQLRAITSNPTQHYASELINFVKKAGGFVPRERIADLATVDKMVDSLGRIASRVPEGSPERALLGRLSEALKKDIDVGLNKLEPELALAWKSGKQQISDIMGRFSTTEGLNLRSDPSKGFTTRERSRSPLTALQSAMGDPTKFRNFKNMFGQGIARQTLVHHILEKSRDNLGYNWEVLSNNLRNYGAHFNELGSGNAQLKHGLSVFANAVKMQNRLRAQDLTDRAVQIGTERAIVNIVAGGAIGSPRWAAFSGSKLAEISFKTSTLAKILSEPNAPYQIAKLMATPITDVNYPSRMRNFMQILGKLGVVGQVQNIDGSTRNVVINETNGQIENEEDRVAVPPF